MAKDNPAYVIAAVKTVAARIGGNLPEGSHPHARKVQAEVLKLATSMEALARVWETQSPTDTAEGHQKKVSAAAVVFGRQVAAARDRLHDLVRQGVKDIEQRSRLKTGLKADEFASEVRATVRALGIEAKLALLGDLARNKRGSELAAVVDAPTILTGITDDLATRFRELIETSHAPEEYQERIKLLEAFGEAFDMTALCADAASNFADPGKLATIERGEEAAAAAIAAFNEAAQA
jgi:hypothetical protein